MFKVPVWETRNTSLSCAGGSAIEQRIWTIVTWDEGGAIGLCQGGSDHWIGTVKVESCSPEWRVV